MPDSSFCLAGRGDDGLETFVEILELVGVEGKGRSVGVGELGELGDVQFKDVSHIIALQEGYIS